MIDIHTHILPFMDDGAEDMSDALLMAELSAESGVQAVIATPHCNLSGEYENYYGPAYQRRIEELRKAVAQRNLPLKVLAGMEIYITEDTIDKIKDGRLISLNGSGRYLVEFGFYKNADWMTERLDEMRSVGIKLVVAHPERYLAVQKHPELVMDWMDMGCQLQMNRGSIFGRFGRRVFRAADELLSNDWITYIASDAHSPYQRTTYMRDIYDFLAEEFSEGYARRLLIENPERYLLMGDIL